MSSLFLDALFPDPTDPQSGSASSSNDFSSGNPFALSELYPSSVLSSSTHTNAHESNIFDIVDLKGCVTYGHNQHIAKKQRLTYQQDSVKIPPPSIAESTAAAAVGDAKISAFWQGGGLKKEFSLFTLPEEFKRDFEDIWRGDTANIVVDASLGNVKKGEELVETGVESEAEEEEEDLPDTDSDNDADDYGYDDDDDGDDDYDLWLDPTVAVPLEKPRYQTWDSFLVPDGNNPKNPYLTEAGPHVFDAALELHQNDVWSPKESGTVVRTDVFIICLLHLGLGRSSVLFQYNRARHAFYPVKDGLRPSGFSVGTVSSVVKMFAQCGKRIKGLQRFTERVCKEVSPIPTRVALAECTTTILSALQTRLSIPPSSITSIVHLESLFREPSLILETLYRIMLDLKGIKEDSQLLSKLFQIVEDLQFTGGTNWLRPILLELVRRVSRAWLEVVEQWIGLRGSLGVGLEGEWEGRQGFFVKVVWEEELDERGRERKELRYTFDKAKVPVFFTNEDAEMVFECGKSLRFLNEFHPGHPLSKPGTVVKPEDMPTLDWKFSWENLEGIHKQAKAYESALRKAIASYTVSGSKFMSASTSFSIMKKPSPTAPGNVDIPADDNFTDIFTKSAAEIAAALSASVNFMSAPLPSLNTPTQFNPLRHATMHTHANAQGSDYLTTFAPPLSISPLLSFSKIFTVQSRLVNAACLRMFFVEHGLRRHFQVLYKFLLLGDSVFTSRVSNALFSDEDEYDVTERKDGEYRTGGRMGLHVASRDSWPPASSELRLALTGLLSEAYHGPSPQKGKNIAGSDTDTDPHSKNGSELPGALSFAIRQLSEEEFETVMDPHGLSALDFLKINYSPPRPLGEVIGTMALYKYDRIFRLLLRLVRMRFVVDQLWRDVAGYRSAGRKGAGDESAEGNRKQMVETKFRVGAQHFVNCFAGYIWEVAVGESWKGWEKRLDAVQKALDKEARGEVIDGVTKGGVGLGGLSLAGLTAAHSAVLDRIMFLTFLRRRQQPVVELVESIFGYILKFARYIRARKSGKRGKGGDILSSAQLEELYYSFRRKIKMFLDVVKLLSEKRGYGDARAQGTEDRAGGAQSAATVAATSVGNGEGAVFQDLLLRLEMNDWGRAIP